MTIVADDYGIGPETSRAILELARERRLGGAVMIVNTPTAAQAAGLWLAARPECDLGWHPNLTLDRPVCPPEAVPSLVRPTGEFWPLAAFLARVVSGRINGADVRREFAAQRRRFVELIGAPPALVNSHQHVSVFPPCDAALLDVLSAAGGRPFVRRVIEPAGALCRVPGARVKRTALSVFGGRAARRLAARGFPGCQALAGVTDPSYVADPAFWPRWLARLGGVRAVEICCHPGHADDTLLGRDCRGPADLRRRPDETRLLRAPDFQAAYTRAGFTPVRPNALLSSGKPL